MFVWKQDAACLSWCCYEPGQTKIAKDPQSEKKCLNPFSLGKKSEENKQQETLQLCVSAWVEQCSLKLVERDRDGDSDREAVKQQVKKWESEKLKNWEAGGGVDKH